MVDSKFVTGAICACLIGVLVSIAILIETKHEARRAREDSVMAEKRMMEALKDIKLAPAISPMKRGISWRTMYGEFQTVEMSCGVGEDIEDFLIRFRSRVTTEKESYPPNTDR